MVDEPEGQTSKYSIQDLTVPNAYKYYQKVMRNGHIGKSLDPQTASCKIAGAPAYAMLTDFIEPQLDEWEIALDKDVQKPVDLESVLAWVEKLKKENHPNPFSNSLEEGANPQVHSAYAIVRAKLMDVIAKIQGRPKGINSLYQWELNRATEALLDKELPAQQPVKPGAAVFPIKKPVLDFGRFVRNMKIDPAKKLDGIQKNKRYVFSEVVLAYVRVIQDHTNGSFRKSGTTGTRNTAKILGVNYSEFKDPTLYCAQSLQILSDNAAAMAGMDTDIRHKVNTASARKLKHSVGNLISQAVLKSNAEAGLYLLDSAHHAFGVLITDDRRYFNVSFNGTRAYPMTPSQIQALHSQRGSVGQLGLQLQRGGKQPVQEFTD